MKINNKEIYPAILSTDINDFNDKVELIAKFSKSLHVDICDGNFAQTKTINLSEINPKTLDRFQNVEYHLMVQNPVLEIENISKLKHSRVIIHIEITDNREKYSDIFYKMKSLGVDVSIAINPYTNYEKLNDYLEQLHIEMILFMGVMPGFQGQRIIPEVIDKIALFNEDQSGNFVLGLDGGINLNSINDLDLSIISHYIIGSGILKDKDPSNAYRYYNSKLI